MIGLKKKFLLYLLTMKYGNDHNLRFCLNQIMHCDGFILTYDIFIYLIRPNICMFTSVAGQTVNVVHFPLSHHTCHLFILHLHPIWILSSY